MSLFHYVKIVIKDELRAIREQFRESKVILIAFLFCVAGIITYLQPFHDTQINIGSSYQGSDWFQMAELSASSLSQKGLDSQVIVTNGAVDNVNRLIDPNDPINATYTYGFALNDAQRSEILSLGSVVYEPIWVFYRTKQVKSIENLHELVNYRVGLGPVGSGSYAIAKRLLEIYDINIDEQQNFISEPFQQAEQRFLKGDTNVLIMVATVMDPIVRNLLQTPGIGILDFKNADAFEKRFNSFQSVRLPAGSIRIYPQIPAKDISLIATTTSVVVKKDMHPDLQLALLMTIREMNRSSEHLFFAKRDQFPAYLDPAVPLSPVAAKFYDYGPPHTMRYLPFWIAGFVDRAWLLLLGLVAIFYPLSKLNLHVRQLRFVVHERPLYEVLLDIDKQVSTQNLSDEEKAAILKRLDAINRHAIAHGVPIGDEPHYFDLVKAIDLIKRKLIKDPSSH